MTQLKGIEAGGCGLLSCRTNVCLMTVELFVWSSHRQEHFRMIS